MSYIMQFFRIIWQSEIFYRNSIFLGSMKQPMFKIWRNLNYPFSIIILSYEKFYRIHGFFFDIFLHLSRLTAIRVFIYNSNCIRFLTNDPQDFAFAAFMFYQPS